jgi:Ca2+-binding EF-hand superfamily protein
METVSEKCPLNLNSYSYVVAQCVGELSSEELKDALSKILKSAKSEKEAEDIVKMLDKDADGKISVIELLQYVEMRKNALEVEVCTELSIFWICWQLTITYNT